jgi:hypothetical protein
MCASLRYFRKAATVLSITLTSMSPGLVVGVHAAVNEGHALTDAAHQLELEIGEAVVAHAAAKTHHGGLAHMRAVGQLAHRQVGERARVGQHQLGHALFGRGQRGQGCLDAFQHGRVGPAVRSVQHSSAQQKPSRAIMALDALGPQVPAAYRRGASASLLPVLQQRARPSARPLPARRCAQTGSAGHRSRPAAAARRRPRARRQSACRSPGPAAPAPALGRPRGCCRLSWPWASRCSSSPSRGCRLMTRRLARPDVAR